MFYFDFGFDNEDYAMLHAPRTMNVFADVKEIGGLLKVLNSCFESEGEIRDKEGRYREVTWMLKDLV